MRALPVSRPSSIPRAFTIVEMLVATAVFMLMVVLLVSVVSQINSAWQQTDGQKSRRQSARTLLDLITRDLQSSLAPVDSANASKLSFVKNPTSFGFSDNHKDSLFWNTSSPRVRSVSDIMTVGYFVRQTSKGSDLCRLQVSGAVSDVWGDAGNLAPADAPNDFRGLVAEGVLAMFVTLYNKDGTVLAAPGESYPPNASNSVQLPYAVDVALVIADPRTVTRMLAAGALPDLPNAETFMNSIPANFRSGVQLYRTRVDLPSAR